MGVEGGSRGGAGGGGREWSRVGGGSGVKGRVWRKRREWSEGVGEE